MIALSILGYYTRRVVINYRNALELYQVCLSEFKETPRTKVAKKYLKDDPIMECDNESMTTSNQHQTMSGHFSIGFDRTGTIKGSIKGLSKFTSPIN